MAAMDHAQEVIDGLKTTFNGNDDVGGRCKGGGSVAAASTAKTQIPIIKEWEYASGSILAFSQIDSCLGVLQQVDSSTLLGAHFSRYARFNSAGDLVDFDLIKFTAVMLSAGFDINKPIIFFGGNVAEWEAGLGQSSFVTGANNQIPPSWDAAQKRWIFQIALGALTHHAW